MRPRRRVLVLASTAEQLGDWRLRLDLAMYHVAGALSLLEAQQALAADPEIRLAVVLQPGNLSIDLLRGVKREADERVKVLLVGCTEAEAMGTRANAVEVAGPMLVARVLQRVKQMSVRKCGPKKRAGRAASDEGTNDQGASDKGTRDGVAERAA